MSHPDLRKQPHPDVPFAYPTYPGYAPNETSMAAAEKIAPLAISIGEKVYQAIKASPSTCYEVEVSLGLAHQTASARFRELALKNRIRPNGEQRKTGSGCKAMVWCVCDG